MNQKRNYNRDKIDQLLGSDLDVEAAWNEFDKSQRRRRPFMFWLTSVLSIILISLFIYTIVDQPSEIFNFKNNEIISSNHKSINSDHNPSLKQEETISNKNLSSTTANYPSTNLHDKVDFNQEKSFSNKDQIEKISNVDIDQQPKIHDQLNRLDDLNKNDKVNINAAEGQSGYNDLPTHAYQNTLRNFDGINNEEIMDEQSHLSADNKLNDQMLPLYLKNSRSNGTETEIVNIGLKAVKLTSAHTKLNVSLLPLIQSQELHYKSKSALSILPKASAANRKPNHNLRYSLSYYAGIGGFTRSLAFSEDNLLQQRRQESEQPLLSHTIGLGFNIGLTDKLYLESGLSYTNNISKISDIIQQTVNTEKAEDILIAYQIRDGVSQNVFGTATVDNIEVVKKTRFQQYKSFSIPITLSYAQAISNRFRMEIGAGVQYALLQSVVGETYDSVESLGEYGPVSDYGYKSSNHFEFRTHAGIRSYLSEHIEIGLRAIFLSDLQSRTSRLSEFGDRFNSLNISLHMTTHF